ncbi:hypothetical protein GOP47_0027090 [Adiantum capillus-veneris]|nr:hypothetical protein GOP47_0027090 [Adiantum capillus-veneris]
MPTLRVELLKSREENVIVEKRVMHSSRVKLAAGHSQHASKSKKCDPTQLKCAAKERVSMGKVLGITKKLGASTEVNGALLPSFKGHTPQSPSESDSFSIASSSSSYKSEADSIKKPSPPTSMEKQPSTESLHINLGSYFGAMWDANHIPPCDLSKAIHEKFYEGLAPQNGFLEFRFSKGRMIDSRPRKMDEGRAKGQGASVMKHLSMEASGVPAPTFSSASGKTVSKTSCQSPNLCNSPFLGHELNQTQSIKELMAESQDLSHEEGPVRSAEEYKQCHMEGGHHTCDGHNELICMSQATKQEVSMHPIKASCGHTGLVIKESTHPGVFSGQVKPASANACMVKYVYSTPLMVGKCQKITIPEADAMTSPPVREIKCKANYDGLIPLSPLSLSEASTVDNYDDECGRDYSEMAWLATSRTQEQLAHPCKAQWDWRSKSIGARASLRSAVRNLEAAFGGSRSISVPKTRSQTDERERKSESSKFINRVFVSPVKNRYRNSETLKQSAQRLSYSGPQVLENLTRNGTLRSREAHCNDNRLENAGSEYCLVQPGLPQRSKNFQKSDMLDSKVSTIPFLPTSRSVHSLTPLKDLSSLTSPLIATPPSSALSPLSQPASYMLQGYLQCFQRDGKTCYTLSLKDSDEMLLAKACTFALNLSKEGCKCMYTFQSGRSKSRGKGTNGWRSWLKKDSKFTTDMAGKMQVSSELSSEISPAGKRMQFLVSEFVLYEERNDEGTRSRSLRFSSSSDGSHSTYTPIDLSPLSAQSAYEFAQPAIVAQKQAPSIPRSPSSARMSSKWASINHQARSYSPLKKRTPAHHHPSYSIDGWSDIAEPEVPQERSYSACQSELAAIVIKMPIIDDDEDSYELSHSACRRSLNFSEDRSKGPQKGRQNKCRTLGVVASFGAKRGGTASHPTSGCVTLMLPKDRHGLPKDGTHGPTTLINRWKCGGKCDCGGWDLGCGMKVFSTQRCEMHAASSDYGNSIQSIAHKQPLVLYSQGTTQRVLLSLCLIQEGYFILKFHSDLSPLRAFAASVAILHGRESSTSKGKLLPTMKTNQQCHSEPETVGRSNDRPAFLEVCNDIPTWRPAGGRALSPYGRA